MDIYIYIYIYIYTHTHTHVGKVVGKVTCLHLSYQNASHILLTCWRNLSSKNVWVSKVHSPVKNNDMIDIIVMFLC